ncbi:phosphoribosyltransferase [Dysgonomonas sp. ZJ709]|uniref:phosphoribosyltransferase n=1 Tax=Dysgonomonas sp. ZJ709 TaxID=2709797 RepID=UPI0013EE250E|nr:phosphoribosyltransferase [Dysgonomonas sp. ZJ709]
MQGKTFEEVLERFRTIPFHEDFDIIVAIANGGVVPAAILNQRLDIEIQLLKINLRDSTQKPKYDSPRLIAPIDFEFKNKRILLVEDRVKTGASLTLAVALLQGAKFIKTFAVNGNADYALYNEDCFKFPWIL